MNLSKKITFLISTVFLFQFCFIKAEWKKLGSRQFKTISKTRTHERRITALGLDDKYVYEWSEKKHKWIKLGSKQFLALSFPWALDLKNCFCMWKENYWQQVSNFEFKAIHYPMTLDNSGHVYLYKEMQLQMLEVKDKAIFENIFVSSESNNLALTLEGIPYLLMGSKFWFKVPNTVNFEKIFGMFGLGKDKMLYKINNLVVGGCEKIGEIEFQDLRLGQKWLWLLGFDNIIYKLSNDGFEKTSDILFEAVFDDLALDQNGYVYEWREGEGKRPCLLL